MQLDNIGNVTVQTAGKICRGGESVAVTFVTELGDVPLLTVDSSTLDGRNSRWLPIPYRGECPASSMGS